MANLTLEPDRPPGGPGSHGPGPHSALAKCPWIRAFNTWDSAGMCMGEAEAAKDPG